MRTPTHLAMLLACIQASANVHEVCSPHQSVSKVQQTPLVELYTSEGCSSCPPADRWLSGLDGAGLGTQVVALAFHVDYWDYLGWKDRFAQAMFSQRQHQRADQIGAAFVYTPQVMLNGRDWRNANYLDLRNATQAAPKAAAQLSLQTAPQARGIDVSLQATSNQNGTVYIALYENQLSSQVAAGENSGEHLRHDRVVRALRGPYRLDAQGKLKQAITLEYASDQNPAHSGVAAWVENSQNGSVVQSIAADCTPTAN